MSDELEQLEDDINHDWWTVLGFCHETWERWGGHYDCLNPRVAEDLAQMEAREQGWNLAVVSVIEGKHIPADQYATWVDPDVRDQPEMNQKLRDLGYIKN